MENYGKGTAGHRRPAQHHHEDTLAFLSELNGGRILPLLVAGDLEYLHSTTRYLQLNIKQPPRRRRASAYPAP